MFLFFSGKWFSGRFRLRLVGIVSPYPIRWSSFAYRMTNPINRQKIGVM
jgi:hypothetical protein